MSALDWPLERVTGAMHTLAEPEAPQTDSRRPALLRDLAQYAAEGRRH